MSRARWIVAATLLLALAALLVWQHQRERLVAGCVAQGGAWNGARNLCEPRLPSPILRRDLERS